jgi:hypothetical protein
MIMDVGRSGDVAFMTLAVSTVLCVSTASTGCYGAGGHTEENDSYVDDEEDNEREPTPVDTPLRVDVTVTAAIVAPAKLDKCQWDGISCQAISQELVMDALNEERTVWIPTIVDGDPLSTGIVAVQLSVFESR